MDAAAELLPQIMSHPLTSMEGVLDRQGPIWDMVQEHASYDEETTDFVDPLRLSDQAVFRDGSVLVWSLTDGWVASRGEHSPFPHMRLIRHDGGADAAGEVARGGPLLAAVIAARAGFISSLLPIPSRAGAGAEPKSAHR